MSSTTAIIKMCLSLLFVLADVLVLVGLRRVPSLSQHPIMVLNAALFTTEIFKIGAQVSSEYPMEIVNYVLFACPLSDLWALWSLIPWFSSVYLYPLLALLHLCAIFRPLLFKSLKRRLAFLICLVVLVVSSSMALAYVIPSCGIYYDETSLYWAFRFERAHVYYMEQFNYILTVSSISITIAIDVLIVVLMIRWQRKKTKNVSKTVLAPETQTRSTMVAERSPVIRRDTAREPPPPPSRMPPSMAMNYTAEVKLALNFFCVSFIFIWEFFAFNFVAYQDKSGAILLATSIISNAKGSCYLIFSRIIRESVIGIFR